MPNPINQASPDQMQQGAADARGEPGLPLMPAKPGKQAAAGPAMPKKPDKSTPAPAGATMKPVTAAAAGEGKPTYDMQPHPDAPGSAAPALESYLRLRVRVVRDRLTIIGVREVEGPLVQSPAVAGEHVYEATLDAQPIAIEGIIDVGASRSYPRPGKHEHKITELPSFEFNVRIPRAAVPENAFGRIALALYRFPDASQRFVRGTVKQQFGQQARTVARLDALRPEAFAPEARAELQRLFAAKPD